jgi:cysteine desulfurase
MQRPIYLDYAATTPVDQRVADKMWQYLTIDGVFGNPASTHIYGLDAKLAVEDARVRVAQLINASPDEIIFTSGATESNNIAIKGAAYFHQDTRKHIITVKTEHKSVLDPCYALAEQGFDVEFITPQKNGLIDIAQLIEKIRHDTLMVSIMHVNNEIGIVQDLAQIGALTRAKNILLHVDAAQSAGRELIDVANMQIDLLSLSAHKMYGPKGIGALYMRRRPRVRLQALMEGGGHEQGLRPGTLATHQIVGMGEAAHLARLELEQDNQRLRVLRDELWAGLQDLPGIYLNTDLTHSASAFLNVSFAGLDGEMLLSALPGIALSTGSACTSAQTAPSHVLKALGVAPELAQCTLRMTLGRFTTTAEIAQVITWVRQAVLRLQGVKVWPTHGIMPDKN